MQKIGIKVENFVLPKQSENVHNALTHWATIIFLLSTTTVAIAKLF